MVWDKWFHRWTAHGSQEGLWAYCDGLTLEGERKTLRFVQQLPSDSTTCNRGIQLNISTVFIGIYPSVTLKGLSECHDFNDMSKVSVKTLWNRSEMNMTTRPPSIYLSTYLPWGKFLRCHTDVHLDFEMDWLRFAGQRWALIDIPQ